MEFKVVNFKNEEVKKIKGNDSVWKIEINKPVVRKYFRVLENNVRKFTADVKDRGEVSGGGRKPWAQKGTGRARHGSIRSPIWVGGGKTHGPIPLKRWMRINTKERQVAIRSLLSGLVKEGMLAIVADDEVTKFNKSLAKAKGMTKLVFKTLKAFSTDGDLAYISTGNDENIKLGLGNIDNIRYFGADSINWLNVTKMEKVIMTENVFLKLDEIYKK